MAQGLSALARVLKKHSFEEFAPKDSPITRDSMRGPVRKGLTRGSMGSTGSRRLQERDPEAQEKEERQFLQAPSFDEMMSDLLSGGD